jgi:hypothetical protein
MCVWETWPVRQPSEYPAWRRGFILAYVHKIFGVGFCKWVREGGTAGQNKYLAKEGRQLGCISPPNMDCTAPIQPRYIHHHATSEIFSLNDRESGDDWTWSTEPPGPSPIRLPPPGPLFSSSPEKVTGVNDCIVSSAVELAGKYNAHVIIHKLSTLHNSGYSVSDLTANVPPHKEELVWKLGVRAGWPGEEARQKGVGWPLVPVSALDAFPPARVRKK